MKKNRFNLLSPLSVHLSIRLLIHRSIRFLSRLFNQLFSQQPSRFFKIVLKSGAVFSLLLSIFGLGACTKFSMSDRFFHPTDLSAHGDRAGIDPKPEYKASSKMPDSFVQTKRNQIVILKSALEKEFLLSTNMITQSPTPMFGTLQSRVVFFRQKGKQLLMLEGSAGRSVGNGVNIPQNLLIAAFPIESEKNDRIEFDFNEGMKNLITAGDMFASDDTSISAGFNYELPIAKIQASYLDQVRINKDSMQIQQVAQLEKTELSLVGPATTKLIPIAISYILTPYLPDPSFVPVRSPGFASGNLTQVGYFEANPIILEDGSTRINAMKWNEKKPIVFAVSANTPAEYRELVKASVLYWNKILGADRVQVIQLEDKNITAPNDQYNIIQWADWDAAGFAYADAHIDPRSGEITHAQVFFPSAFINANVERRIRLMESARQPQTAVGLSGFKSARFCQRNILKDLSESQIDFANISKEAMDKAMRDYVFEVIAHEVGHLMGLRHNFAGNLISNYDASQRPQLSLDYYKNMKAPEGIQMTSSVMEYSRFEESAWDGDILQRSDSKALPYDEVALKYLYFAEKVPKDSPAFCTDSDINKYVDCNMSDAGQSVVSYARDNYLMNLKTLPMKIFNLYVAKTKIADEKLGHLVNVEDVALDPKAVAKSLSEDYFKTIANFKSGSHFIKVSSQLLSSGVNLHKVDEELLKTKESEYLSAEVLRLGGLRSVTQDGLLSATVWMKNFEAILENPRYATGDSLGQKYSFSAEEKQIMKTEFAKFATQAEKELELLTLAALSGQAIDLASYGQTKPEETPAWIDHPLMDEMADILLEKFEQYALGSTSTLNFNVILKTGFQKNVELPIYTYDQKTRLAAATLFSNKSEAIEWAYLQKKQMTEKAQEPLELISLDEVDLAKYPRSTLQPVLKWVLQAQELKESIK